MNSHSHSQTEYPFGWHLPRPMPPMPICSPFRHELICSLFTEFVHYLFHLNYTKCQQKTMIPMTFTEQAIEDNNPTPTSIIHETATSMSEINDSTRTTTQYTLSAHSDNLTHKQHLFCSHTWTQHTST